MESALIFNTSLVLAVLRQVPGNYLILLPNSPQFTIAEVSESYNLLTNTIREEILGKGVFEVFPDNPEVEDNTGVANLSASLEIVLTTKESHQMEVHKYDIPVQGFPMFEERYWLSSNKPVIVNNEVVLIIHSTEDITEERQLKNSESYFKTIADDSPFMIWRCIEGLCNYVNKAWIEFTGLSYAASLGTGFYKAFHPEDIEREASLYKEAMQTGSTYESKYRIIKQDGEVRWVITKATPHITDGRLIEYIGSIIDITDQETVRQHLEESTMQLRQLTDSIIQMVWVTDASGMHEYYNKRWYEFTGTSVEHTLGEGWIQMFHPDDRERAWQHWQHSLSTGEPYEIEYRLLKHTGEFVWVLGRAAPIYNLNGEIIKWFGTCTDIHEQKMLQQQKEDFISIASHELKTPLTSLSASLQFLERQVKKEPALDPMTSKLVNSARTHLNKLTGLVKDLLDFSKIERGQLILQKSLFSISEMIDSCCDTIRMDGFKITLTGDTEAKVSADYLKVEQVIVNLLNNCVKYASQSKEIIIHTEQIDGFLKISVRDFGPGIPKEKLPHLFDVYYRAEKKGNQNSGLGLGLYICAQIIDEHGGVMGVDSELGQGSTFWFTLPLS